MQKKVHAFQTGPGRIDLIRSSRIAGCQSDLTSRSTRVSPFHLQSAVIIPMAAAISIILAMLLVSALSRLRPVTGDGFRDTLAGAGVLTNPHSPMTPQQRLEEMRNLDLAN